MTQFTRLTCAADLDKVRESAKQKLVLRHYDRQPSDKKFQILVCGGTGCTSSHSRELIEALKKSVAAHDADCDVIVTGCHGFCEMGPLVICYPGGYFYTKVQESDADEIIEKTIMKGESVTRLHRVSDTGLIRKTSNEMVFYNLQKRLVLRNCGHINPEDIEEYIAADGYRGLVKAMEIGRMAALEEVKISGLRGRGGAGFPTGRKWELTIPSEGEPKYMLCNADEGDPGAFMDRSILEADPHAVIEGMLIGAYVVGCTEGYIYVRAEYPLAIKRLKIAIAQAEQMGLLGDNILGTDFCYHLKLKEGAGAFVCGEETALMRSIEGKRGMPRVRPPFPAQKGVFDKPTVLNNVETFANIPRILFEGGAKYRELGTENSPGTKVFALTGKVNKTGLVEVPMGVTMRHIIFNIGGGIKNDKKFKAVQIGGPSGACLPESLLDNKVDYDSLKAVGAIVGSGGLVVVDEDTCMVDLARFFLSFTQAESCGKCTPCREGSKRMLEILERICNGKGREGDIETLEHIAKTMQAGSLCALGQTAPNPVLSTLRYFRDEYEAHIKEKRCPAHACKNMMEFYIDPAVCIGCGMCARACPAEAISGEKRQPHVIDVKKCVKCGTCEGTCRKHAIIRR